MIDFDVFQSWPHRLHQPGDVDDKSESMPVPDVVIIAGLSLFFLRVLG